MTPAEDLEREIRREAHLEDIYMELTGAHRAQARDVFAMLVESSLSRDSTGDLSPTNNLMLASYAGGPAGEWNSNRELARVYSEKQWTGMLAGNPRFA